LSAVRQAKAIEAVKLIQQQSIKNGNNKMTLKEINAIINDVRRKNKR
jgi:D-arabinose 1-dehydrogenase-like Zn-dependent alcohol dehydrogenase